MPELVAVDRWWRAANYLSAGQIYLRDNALLRHPLAPEHIKPRLLGHWGTSPALNLVWAHLNRVICERALQALYIAGPGHGGPAMLANAWLEGGYSERYPRVSLDERGVTELFRQFSTPGGVPSHAAPQTPGSIHEGGELGYSLAHAFGAALDAPGRLVACVVGDGEAETGTLAASWHLNAFLNPATDGTVLPILNLNGWKIANPTVLARLPESQLVELFRGYGYAPVIVGGDVGVDPMTVHEAFASALDDALDRIEGIRAEHAGDPDAAQPAWPMIVLRTPKGWTGPREVDGEPVEGTWRSHQVPLAGVRDDPAHLRALEEWLRSYRPEELFTEAGAPMPELDLIRPRGEARMSATPAANGGELLRDLLLPDAAAHRVTPGTTAESTRRLGGWLAEVIRDNPHDFRLFGPDETASNRLDAVFEVTSKQWMAGRLPVDAHLARSGRVIEVLSENLLQGLLEGYVLTGRHGLLASYEAFIHIVDSMFNQHAKWLEVADEVPWRRSVASLNYLLSSHVWRQDHNGFSHQDPGFLNLVVNKGPGVVRVYLPPDANTLLVTAEHCLASRDHVNVIVAGKQPEPTYLSYEAAIAHGERGLGVWDWAGTEVDGSEPDAVVAAAGDVPTLEALAAVQLLREAVPDLRLRFVNVVDLMRLRALDEHPHGLAAAEFSAVFTDAAPVVFAFHGYPSLIHQLAYRQPNHGGFHVHGFAERGTTTTPFDMLRMNGLDRYTLALAVLRHVPGAELRHPHAVAHLAATRERMRVHAHEFGDDSPEVTSTAWLDRLIAAARD
ncbi:xylulose-5-phosphate/fructose-6-phosphate phosphoketolase [Agromyces flavus]|uniref:Xylulose-5-phosphate/fructose-6-phosphate phosphoketolase n=1 Tax=Agromyces flavus TaxID=589382 RepID=A0A1H1XIJ0_9MICO|nr:phosphoketolase family protein [Agromyces flavus]MCP2366426.1 xylulose-5-phosphate/fructose-6-phosphate phosphoketolase [Agromyces flavus]GGI44653.1 putative phosphoketolase [Agromyces flavus]SDT09030.1 xylulose-5-phosphate/fructose-6-phosphate phosphoketolase [Agromyces flavus]